MTVAELIRSELEALSESDRAAVIGVRFVIKGLPDREDLARGCTPDQGAAFWGVGRELGGEPGAPLPDNEPASGEITIFLANLAPLDERRIRIAVKHELMHALGWTEDEIRGMGLELEGGKPLCGGGT